MRTSYWKLTIWWLLPYYGHIFSELLKFLEKVSHGWRKSKYTALSWTATSIRPYRLFQSVACITVIWTLDIITHPLFIARKDFATVYCELKRKGKVSRRYRFFFIILLQNNIYPKLQETMLRRQFTLIIYTFAGSLKIIFYACIVV